jgi:hypothetical protein
MVAQDLDQMLVAEDLPEQFLILEWLVAAAAAVVGLGLLVVLVVLILLDIQVQEEAVKVVLVQVVIQISRGLLPELVMEHLTKLNSHI